MATNTKLLQAMADVMLPLFNNMPRVLIVIEDHEVFHQANPPLAVYRAPDILINPKHPPTSSFNNLKDTICHELIHAWLDWKRLDGLGEFLDDFHNEWFVRKALEITKLNIDGLKVDIDFLLTTPKAVRIYNRVAGIPHPHDETPVVETPGVKEEVAVKNQLVEIFGLSKNDYFSKVLIACFLVVLASMFLARAHLIPDPIAAFLWCTWAVAALIWLTIETWKDVSGKRLPRMKAFQRTLSWPDGIVNWSLGLAMVALVCVAFWLLRITLLFGTSRNRASAILVAAALFYILFAVFYIGKFSWSKKWDKIMAALTIGSLVLYALVVLLK